MSIKLSTHESKRLEITMRDVMGGLEDAASYINYHSVPDVVEILSIEPPGRTIQAHPEVIQLNKTNSSTPNQNSNIVEYLIERELKRTA